MSNTLADDNSKTPAKDVGSRCAAALRSIVCNEVGIRLQQLPGLIDDYAKSWKYPVHIVSFSLERQAKVDFEGSFESSKYGWKFIRTGYRLVLPVAALACPIRINDREISFEGCSLRIAKSRGDVLAVKGEVSTSSESFLQSMDMTIFEQIADWMGFYEGQGLTKSWVTTMSPRALFTQFKPLPSGLSYPPFLISAKELARYFLAPHDIYRHVPSLKVLPSQLENFGLSYNAGARDVAKSAFGVASFSCYNSMLTDVESLRGARVLQLFFTSGAKINHVGLRDWLESKPDMRGQMGLEQHRFSGESCTFLRREIGATVQQLAQLPDFADTLEMLDQVLAHENSDELKKRCIKRFGADRRALSEMHDYLVRVLKRRPTGSLGKPLPSVVGVVHVPEFDVFIPKNIRDINEIGRQQLHCVYSAGYHKKMLKQSVLIWALMPSGQPLATGVCVEQTPYGSIIQIKGRRNRAPTDEEKSAVEFVAKTLRFA
jgi:hypothetical protein